MARFKNLSDKKIHEIWSKNIWNSEIEVFEFRCELIRRGFVSWDEIYTKWEVTNV